jgi:hypothetical protein
MAVTIFQFDVFLTRNTVEGCWPDGSGTTVFREDGAGRNVMSRYGARRNGRKIDGIVDDDHGIEISLDLAVPPEWRAERVAVFCDQVRIAGMKLD